MSTSIVVAYPFSPEELALRVADLRDRNFLTPSAYKEGVKAIATCREMRVLIEERRKLLKHDSLEYGRKVDDVAKQLTAVIEAVELPLKDARREVDDAKEKAKREAALAEQRRVEAEAREKLEAEAEQHRAQRAAEEKRLAAERAELDKERARMQQERQELEQLRQEAKLRREAAEAQEQAAKAEQRAAEKLARLAAEFEEARLNQLEHDRQRAKRLAALQPDQDKLTQMARAILACADEHGDWEFETEGAVKAADEALEALNITAGALEAWKDEQR